MGSGELRISYRIESCMKSFAPMSPRIVLTGWGNRRRAGSCTMIGAVSRLDYGVFIGRVFMRDRDCAVTTGGERLSSRGIEAIPRLHPWGVFGFRQPADIAVGSLLRNALRSPTGNAARRPAFAPLHVGLGIFRTISARLGVKQIDPASLTQLSLPRLPPDRPLLRLSLVYATT